MILHSTRTALARYRSVLLFMSFISELVTMMTSSAEGQMSLMHRYTMRRRLVSLFWNSLVTEKNTSDASFCEGAVGARVVQGRQECSGRRVLQPVPHPSRRARQCLGCVQWRAGACTRASGRASPGACTRPLARKHVQLLLPPLLELRGATRHACVHACMRARHAGRARTLVKDSPWASRYSSLVMTCWHLRGSIWESLKHRASCAGAVRSGDAREGA